MRGDNYSEGEIGRGVVPATIGDKGDLFFVHGCRGSALLCVGILRRRFTTSDNVCYVALLFLCPTNTLIGVHAMKTRPHDSAGMDTGTVSRDSDSRDSDSRAADILSRYRRARNAGTRFGWRIPNGGRGKINWVKNPEIMAALPQSLTWTKNNYKVK